MRRRDFLAMCAAAVGCAAVPVNAEPAIETIAICGRPTFHTVEIRYGNGDWQLLEYDGEQWIEKD